MTRLRRYHVDRAIAALPEWQRAVFYMGHLEGRPLVLCALGAGQELPEAESLRWRRLSLMAGSAAFASNAQTGVAGAYPGTEPAEHWG